MSLKNTKLKQFREILRNPFVWLAAFGVFILIIIIVAALVNIFRANPYGSQTSIDNFGDYVKDMPIEKRDAVFNMLYTRISMEGGGEVANVPTSGAMIREGSFSSIFDETTTLHSGSFIVDIEAIHQSYVIQYEWADQNDAEFESSYSVVINCPLDDQNIYSDFKCNRRNDTLSSTDSVAILGNYAPYFGQTDDGFGYFVKLQYYNGGAPYAEVDANSCGDEGLLQSATEAAKAWMQSVGVSLEEIPVESRDLCDGGV